jgi:hypothetical protein
MTVFQRLGHAHVHEEANVAGMHGCNLQGVQERAPARPGHDLHQVLASYGFDIAVDLTADVLKDVVIRH